MYSIFSPSPFSSAIIIESCAANRHILKSQLKLCVEKKEKIALGIVRNPVRAERCNLQVKSHVNFSFLSALPLSHPQTAPPKHSRFPFRRASKRVQKEGHSSVLRERLPSKSRRARPTKSLLSQALRRLRAVLPTKSDIHHRELSHLCFLSCALSVSKNRHLQLETVGALVKANS